MNNARDLLILLSSEYIPLAADIPKGVAALPRPRIFEEIFKIVFSEVFLFLKAEGNNLLKTGENNFESFSVSPASEATFAIPQKKTYRTRYTDDKRHRIVCSVSEKIIKFRETSVYNTENSGRRQKNN